MTSRIEVTGRISGRRHLTVEQKLEMLRDAFGPDGRVRAAMERHEVNSGQLYTWRREAMSGALRISVLSVRPAFAEAQVAEMVPIAEPLPALSAPPLPPVAPPACESSLICIGAERLQRDAALAGARADIAALDLLIDILCAQFGRLKRMSFGKSSEKLTREIAQLELALEELEAAAAAVAGDGQRSKSAADRTPPVRALPAHLLRHEIIQEPVSGACACPACGGALRPLSADADEMLDVVPVSWQVIRRIRPKYSCRACDTIVQAPAPVKAIARGKATFATLAHIVVAKFDHHLPLYRQAEMMAAQGIDIDRSTLACWTGQTAALLDPIVARIREQGLTATKLHTDDTPVPVLGRGRGRTVTGRFWVYAVDDRASGATTVLLVWYEFTSDSTGAHPQKHLASDTGFLQADAYAGCNQLYAIGRVTEVACWAHFRRKIFDIHQAKPTALTSDLLDSIAALYAVEADVRGQPPDVRHAARKDRSPALVDALRAALDDALRRLSPKSEMAKAIGYGVKLWPALLRFIDDGRLEIDINIAEGAIHSIAVGRRDWLFAGSKVGGERATAIYSVIETCKANGVDPQAYIADVIAGSPATGPHRAGTSSCP